MREDDFIVSKTDPQGRITYGNRIFIEYSGYSELQLLGAQHNMIRHPDMPRSVFHLLWQTIQSGNEFFGYVKNLSKDGGFYWVFANITPSYGTQRKLVGYCSVRRAPKRSALNVVEPLYRQMLQAEKRAGSREAIAAGTQVLNDHVFPRYSDYEKFVLAI